jgi:hypothetical protein
MVAQSVKRHTPQYPPLRRKFATDIVTVYAKGELTDKVLTGIAQPYTSALNSELGIIC